MRNRRSWQRQVRDYLNELEARAGITSGGLSEHEAEPNPHDKMNWVHPYVQGADYFEDDVVTNGSWTMIANKDTLEYPFPQAAADVAWAVFGDAIPTWVAQSTSTTRLLTGIRIVPNYVAVVQAIRVWIPIIDPDVGYYVVSEVEGQVPQYTQIFPTETGWFPITFSTTAFATGVPVEIYLVTQGQGTTSTTFTHNFTYRLSAANPNPDNPPTLGQFRHFNTNAPDIAYINKTDADGVSRKGDLDTLQAGDTIAWTDSGGVDVFFTLTADPIYYNSPVGEEDFYELNISPAVGQGSNGTVAMTFTHFLDRPTSYVQITDQFLGVADVKGLLSTTGNIADVVQTDDAYGIDVLYQEVSFPADWDVVAHSAIASDAAQANRVGIDTQSPTESVDTTNAAWTEVARVTMPASGGYTAAVFFDGIRQDAVDFYTSQLRVLAHAGNVDDVQIYKMGPNQLDVRATLDGTDVVYEVKGQVGQHWQWYAVAYWRQL